MPALPLTKLSITRWAQIMGVHPLHFWGLTIPAAIAQGACSSSWPQYSWQAADRVSREGVALAIQKAEANIESYLGWQLMPAFTTADRREIPKPYQPHHVFYGSGSPRGQRASVFATWGRFIQGGTRKATLVDADAAVTYTDIYDPTPEDDTYPQTASWVVTTTAPLCELRAFYPGKAAAPEWEIRPLLNVVDNGNGTVTMSCRREQLVLEATYQDTVPAYPDCMDDANFLEEIAVYRITVDPATQMTAQWEPGGCGCTDEGCNCALVTGSACLLARDPRLGVVTWTPGTYDADEEEWTFAAWTRADRPDSALLYYLSGYESPRVTCPMTTMDPMLEQMVAQLACAYLDREVCACAQDRVNKWAVDYAFDKAGKIQAQALFNRDTNNPFGSSVAGVDAWRFFTRAQAEFSAIPRSNY